MEPLLGQHAIFFSDIFLFYCTCINPTHFTSDLFLGRNNKTCWTTSTMTRYTADLQLSEKHIAFIHCRRLLLSTSLSFDLFSLYPNTIVVISVFMFLIMKMPNKKQQQQQDEKWNLSCKIKVKVSPCVASGNSIELNVYIKSRWIVICRIKQRNCAWLAIYVRCAICVPCAVPCAYDSHTLPVVLWGQ